MASLADQFWVVVSVLAAVCCVGVLHCIAGAVRNETYLHDLKVRVAALRAEKLRRLRESQDERDATRVILVDEEEPEVRQAA